MYSGGQGFQSKDLFFHSKQQARSKFFNLCIINLENIGYFKFLDQEKVPQWSLYVNDNINFTLM